MVISRMVYGFGLTTLQQPNRDAAAKLHWKQVPRTSCSKARAKAGIQHWPLVGQPTCSILQQCFSHWSPCDYFDEIWTILYVGLHGNTTRVVLYQVGLELRSVWQGKGKKGEGKGPPSQIDDQPPDQPSVLCMLVLRFSQIHLDPASNWEFSIVQQHAEERQSWWWEDWQAWGGAFFCHRSLSSLRKSIDWFKGTITWTFHISWENLWFQVSIFPLTNPLRKRWFHSDGWVSPGSCRAQGTGSRGKALRCPGGVFLEGPWINGHFRNLNRGGTYHI